MEHVPAYVGIFLAAWLPIRIGFLAGCRGRGWQMFWTWLLSPVLLFVAFLLLVWGWGDWPNEKPGDWSSQYFSGNSPFWIVGILGGIGFIAGLRNRAISDKAQREADVKAEREHATYVRAMERIAEGSIDLVYPKER